LPLTDQLRLMADAYPDEVAYELVGDGSVTFSDWEADSNRLARSLACLGVAKADRVVVGLPPEEALRWLVAYAAVHKAGAVAVPLNPRLADPEMVAVLAHSGARAAVVAGELADRLGRLAPDLPSLELLVCVGGAGGSPPEKVVAWEEALHADPSAFQVEVSEEDLADILYTSGTTGTPKGVAVRHKSASLLPTNLPAWTGEKWLHASPLFTFAGVSFVYNPMKLGMSALYEPRFDADEWLDAVERHHPTAVFLVPAMAQLLVVNERFDQADLSSIKLCAIGSAPLAPSTLVRMQERMPHAAVSNSYGMTEAGAAYCAMPQGESLKRIGSVGKPMPPMEVRIVGEDDQVLPAGETGEVLIRLEGRQREYFGDPEATARTWKGGWLHTGDLGRLDEDGYLYITGRKKDVIIRGGNNIHAADVEAVILEHPGVAEVAVIGVPHEVLGEDLAAFLVRAPGCRLGDRELVEELRAHCLERLAEYKAPRRFYVVEALPKNATGKVQKHKIEVPADAKA